VRFSLKWILAGMVYVAIAAAAFSAGSAALGELLWAFSLLANVYASLISIFARGRRQFAAAGFALASLGLAFCLAFGSTANTAIARMLMGPPSSPRTISDLHAYVSAANAVATLAFGLMGSLVGLLAFRAAGHEAQGRNDRTGE
jgi:hypothetical protein